MESWTCEEVAEWLSSIGCSKEVCDTFVEEEINGLVLKDLKREDILEFRSAISVGSRKLILIQRDRYLKKEPSQSDSSSKESATCNAITDTFKEEFRPFDSPLPLAFKYKVSATLPVFETRSSDLTTPIHKFVDIDTIRRGDGAISNICREVVLFACGCLNEHTNGTIHFGVKDRKIIGTELKVDPQVVNQRLTLALKGAFDDDQIDTVLGCVRPAVFVEVQQPPQKCKRYIIEVDVKPSSELCGEETFYARAPEIQTKNQQNFTFEDPLMYRYIVDIFEI